MHNDLNNKNGITPFAITNYRDIRKMFGIKEKNRRGHMYVIGKTGTGKSTLIKNMVVSDFRAGNGVALIDPHGDLAEEVLDYIPKERISDVIYFDPMDTEHPIPLNPLEKVNIKYHHLVASGLISVLKKAWPDFWGPRLEHILRFSILTLLERPGSTILDLTKLLTNKAFQREALEHVAQQQVRDFWLDEFNQYNANLKSQAISPILNKVGQFLAVIPLRSILGQEKNTFRFRQIMDKNMIFIANLSKGRIGEDNCSLLGALIVNQIQMAALSRTDMPEEKRQGFYFYVDEMHNFVTLGFADILSEARKYGLSLILAHQYIEQLDMRLRSAIFGNVGTLISFRVGAEDARYLSREFYPEFGESDLVHLPNYEIYLKLLIDGVSSQPFSARTMPLPVYGHSWRDEIIKESRRRFARS